MDNSKKNYLICILPGIICIVIAEIIIYKGEVRNMDASLIALTVAIIGVAGNLFVLFLQFRKDSNKIGDVKTDTSEIKPRVLDTNEHIKKVRDVVVERLTPKVENADNTGNKLLDGVGKLVSELEFQKRLKNELSGSIPTPDYLVGGIHSIYEENVSLQQIIKERESRIRTLTQENKILSNQLLIAQERIRELETDRGHERNRDIDHDLER